MLSHILEQERNSIVDASLELSQPVLASELQDGQILILQHRLQPSVGLHLWIDTKTPSLSLSGEDTVLK